MYSYLEKCYQSATKFTLYSDSRSWNEKLWAMNICCQKGGALLSLGTASKDQVSWCYSWTLSFIYGPIASVTLGSYEQYLSRGPS